MCDRAANALANNVRPDDFVGKTHTLAHTRHTTSTKSPCSDGPAGRANALRPHSFKMQRELINYNRFGFCFCSNTAILLLHAVAVIMMFSLTVATILTAASLMVVVVATFTMKRMVPWIPPGSFGKFHKTWALLSLCPSSPVHRCTLQWLVELAVYHSWIFIWRHRWRKRRKGTQRSWACNKHLSHIRLVW